MKQRTRFSLEAMILLLAAGPAWAGGPFAGTFVGPEGDRVVLQQQGQQVTGQLVSGGDSAKLEGRAQGAKLDGKIRMPWGDAIGFKASVKGDKLSITMIGDPETAVFTRQSGASAPAQAAPPADAPGAGPDGVLQQDGGPPAAGPVAKLTAQGASSKGPEHKAAFDGWSVRAPKGWKMAERDGALLLGSDTEAGLIIVRHVTERDPGRLQQGLARELAALGGAFGAPPELRRAKLAGGAAVFTEIAGQAQDGTRVQLRAVGVIGPRGTVGIYGLTTPGDKYARLRGRVDAMARSVRFFKPAVSPGRNAVVGEWFSFSSAGSMGTGGSESHLAFCPDGRFFRKGEASYQGASGTADAWGVASQSASAGRWSARGDLSRGTIVITKPDGGTYQISYQIKKPRDGALFNGRLHGYKAPNDLCR